MRHLLSWKMVIIGCLSSILVSAQNIGIGTAVPLQKLHIFTGSSGANGTYPPLVVEGTTNTYINLLASTNFETGILFGRGTAAESGGIVYNNSSLASGLQFRTGGNFTRMVLNNNGWLGIGNITPGFILDVNGRMRVRSGGNDGVSAGIWLNNNAQTQAAFVGMETDNYVGLYGIGSGFKFSMNVNNGALKINGSEGSNGQVLHSNGSGASASWKSSTNQLYHNTNADGIPESILISQSTPNQDIGMSQTFTLTGTAKVLVFVTVGCFTASCIFCSSPIVSVGLYLNDGWITAFDGTIPNGIRYGTISGTRLLHLVAGTYTVKLKTSVEGPDAYVSFQRSSLVVQVIPE